MFEFSGSKARAVEPETSNISYLDHLGLRTTTKVKRTVLAKGAAILAEAANMPAMW